MRDSLRVGRMHENRELLRRLLERLRIEHDEEVRREALPFHRSSVHDDRRNLHPLHIPCDRVAEVRAHVADDACVE